jgi:hypothetical protein
MPPNQVFYLKGSSIESFTLGPTPHPTRMPPNQVFYLKGSSMESFALGPTPKIDFSLSTTTAHTIMPLERTNQLNNLTNNCISSSGIQYRILAVLNAQGPLFIG